MSLNAEQVLAEAKAFVVKVGGDGAGLFDEHRDYPSQMRERAGRDVPVGLVVSAVRSSAAEHARYAVVEPEKGFNTTSHLNAMGDALQLGDGARAKACFEAVRSFTVELIAERVRDPERQRNLGERAEAMFQRMAGIVEEAAGVRHVGKEARFLRAGEDRLFAVGDGGLESFTAFGELLAEELVAANVGGHRLDYAEGANVYLDPKFANFDPARAAQASLDRLPPLLESKAGNVWVMGGARSGRMNSRGYSDVAAVDAMNGWTQFPGRVLVVAKMSPIMSVDHKLLPGKGRLVQGIHLQASTELFGPHGLDAGALHPDAVKALAHPCVVYNPGDLSKGMTLVSNECEVREGVLIVGSKPIPALVRVSSPDMADRHGVFGRVMDALREATLSHTYTSEGNIIVTVNNKVQVGTMADLEGRMRTELDPSYRVQVTDNGYAMVFALGNALSGAREVGRACTALDNAGVKVRFQDLVTEAGVMKFVVDAADAQKAAGVLHEALIENAATLSL